MKKTKWFWSYKIEETEKWLENMANEGYLPVSINRTLRQFHFQKAAPQKRVYSIDYKCSDKARMQQAGWDIAADSGKWTIFSTENANVYPARDRILKRLNVHMYMLLFVLIAFIPVFMIQSIFLLVFSGFGKIGTLTTVFGLLAVLYGAVGWLFIKFRKQEKKLLGIGKQVRTTGKHVRKIRPAWFYEPYQTKRWLQQMFEDGYELERASSIVFYFKERTSEAISYEILYENKVQTDYYSFYQQAGWHLCYTSSTSFMNSSIWAMPYEKGEEPPQITYNPDERKTIMKKNLRMTTFIFVLITLPVLFTFFTEVFVMQKPFFTKDLLGGMRVVNVMVILLWFLIYIRSIRGYVQEKRHMLHI